MKIYLPIAAVPRLRAIVPDWLLMLFAAFIFVSGLSHILVVLWLPAYWTLADEVFATAIVSLATLYFLPLGVAQILHRHSLRAPGQAPLGRARDR
jgi:hypothetical protein